MVPEAYPPEIKRPVLVAWAAGFLDADGTITLNRNRSGNRRTPNWKAIVAAYNRDVRALEVFRGLFGGKISVDRSDHPRWASVYLWVCRKEGIRAALEEMLPYLRVKEKQARLMIDYVRGPGRAVHRGARSEQRARDWYYEQNSYLN